MLALYIWIKDLKYYMSYSPIFAIVRIYNAHHDIYLGRKNDNPTAMSGVCEGGIIVVGQGRADSFCGTRDKGIWKAPQSNTCNVMRKRFCPPCLPGTGTVDLFIPPLSLPWSGYLKRGGGWGNEGWSFTPPPMWNCYTIHYAMCCVNEVCRLILINWAYSRGEHSKGGVTPWPLKTLRGCLFDCSQWFSFP